MHEEFIQELESLRQASGEVESTLAFVENQISELKAFEETVETIEKSESDEFFAPLGKGVFVKSKRLEKDLLVDAGAGVLVKKGPEETRKLIGHQLTKLEEIRAGLKAQLGEFGKELERIRSSLSK